MSKESTAPQHPPGLLIIDVQVVSNVRAFAADLDADPALVEQVYRAMIAKLIGMELREHSSASALKPP